MARGRKGATPAAGSATEALKDLKSRDRTAKSARAKASARGVPGKKSNGAKTARSKARR